MESISFLLLAEKVPQNSNNASDQNSPYNFLHIRAYDIFTLQGVLAHERRSLILPDNCLTIWDIREDE